MSAADACDVGTLADIGSLAFSSKTMPSCTLWTPIATLTRHSIYSQESMMSRMLIVIITLLSSTAHADGPREVVERYGSAITSQNWERALEQVRPQDVANLRPVIMKSLSQPYSEARQLCFGTASTEDIAKMSDVALGACMFKAALSPRAGVSVESRTMTILGSVTEDTNTVHFVVKSQMKVTVMTTVSTVRMEVVTAVREGGVWRVKLPETTTVRSQAETRSAPPIPPPPPPPPPPPNP